MSTKTWQEEYKEKFETGAFYNQFEIRTIKQFIADIRKNDEEELDKLASIKLQQIANTNLDARENSFNELVNFGRIIKDYYAK